MARDTFVMFKEEVPTVEQLKYILEDYLNGSALIEYSSECRWIITLPGESSFAFKRICEFPPNMESGLYHKERWFEVYVGSLNQKRDCGMGPNVDIITRMADDLTNSVATGYAELLSRYFKAELDA